MTISKPLPPSPTEICPPPAVRLTTQGAGALLTKALYPAPGTIPLLQLAAVLHNPSDPGLPAGFHMS